MRTAIVTLPLHTNYGGILQAYALRRVLEDMGHEAVVLDRRSKYPLPKAYKYLTRSVRKVLHPGGVEVFRECRMRREYPVVSASLQRFVDERIAPRHIDSYKDVRQGEYDAFVVGSDQVWRPKYQLDPEDAFLGFTKGWDVKRVAYAASFGTDELEYDYTQLEKCAALLGDFDGVSVRERSAVVMCDEWFDCNDAVHVLDPVMLLSADDYMKIASVSDVHECRGRLLCCFLDRSQAKDAVASRIASAASLEVFRSCGDPFDRTRPLEDRILPSVEEWLMRFADAEFIVTDSFHACVLAILFHKPFAVVKNPSRGVTRLDSLLEMFSMQDRMVCGIDPEDTCESLFVPVDWSQTDSIIQSRRQESMDFIYASLEGKGRKER